MTNGRSLSQSQVGQNSLPGNLPRPTQDGLIEICHAFLRLGCVSFGGPIAHLGYFREEFVEKRNWLADDAFAELVALCQFLPGPASSQVVFALGMRRAGLLGAICASLCFTIPSAILMIVFAYGISSFSRDSMDGWIHGLKLAAVAVVAHAVLGMGRSLCTDFARAMICICVTAMLLVYPGTLTQLVGIAIGGLIGWLIYRASISTTSEARKSLRFDGHVFAAGSLGLFFLLLVSLPFLASLTHNKGIMVFDSFYRTGSVVFGGGHVVLPILRAELVPRGWISDDQFLAGYGAAQALPGPLFTFSAFLGTAMSKGPLRWANGVWCLLAIFLPAWLLVGGALPFWQSLKQQRGVQAALRGANAAVVGVLLAAFWQPVFVESVHGVTDLVAATLAFCLLLFWKSPPILVVVLMAVVGELLFLLGH